jgi:stage II sporulation protein D
MILGKCSKNIVAGLIASLILLSICSVSFADANELNSEEMIRVGLLFDQGTRQEAVPYVTLSSPNGLDVSFSDQTISVLNMFPHEDIAFHLDQFYLLIEETTDIQQAENTNNILKSKNYKSIILEQNQLGVNYYQVIIGYYNSISEAQNIANKIQLETTFSITVKGNFRVQVGVFEDKMLAEDLAVELRGKGFTTHIAVCMNDLQILYKVWIGDSESETSRDNLLDTLKSEFPEKEFIVVQELNNYILAKLAIIDGKQLQIAAIPANTTKIIAKGISNNGEPVVKVNERTNRYYRGTIELLTHNNKLAVVNELLMEEYLYGVVPREMATGWPVEALKAQAVIARTYALGRNGWVIANVVDDVADQAYWGYSIEAVDTTLAVNETRGQVLRTSDNKLVQTFYYSNAGGITAEGAEVWGNGISYLRSVNSPFDNAILERISKWYHVMLANGNTGYIHSNYIVKTGELNKVGFEKALVEGMNVNVRVNADIYHEAFTKVNTGEQVVILDEVYENNAYEWSKGPYDAVKIRNMINDNQRSTNPMIQDAVLSLEVVKRGASGRVMEVQANGRNVTTSSPDAHRSLFADGSSLRSTLFDIESRGSYTIEGANNQTVSYPQSNNTVNIYAIGATGNVNSTSKTTVNNNSKEFIIINSLGDYRVATKNQEFVFVGKGYGHGFGLSQWGAYGMAVQSDEFGNSLYNYVDILHHYYSNDVYLTEVK